MFALMKETQQVVRPYRVAEITGYTTGPWGDMDCAKCSDRCDVLVGTAVSSWKVSEEE